MKTIYQTKDFYLTAYLMASGFTLRGHIKNAGLTVFKFDETPQLNNSVANYYGFTATVNPILHGNAMRTLKSIIHSHTNEPEQYHSRT